MSGGVCLGGTALYIIVYITVKSALRGTGNIAKGSFKIVTRSGDFWGKKIFKGIEAFFSNLWIGVRSIILRKKSDLKSDRFMVNIIW